jgi:O-antigen/teichoic acid export membrane protein
MSRVHRASITATFGYIQFGLTLAVGILMVPFVLKSVGAKLLGYWLASGEILAYAAMADLGVLGVIPWMIAKADGRGDRDGIRRLLSTGLVAALVVSAIYVALVVVLWNVAPTLLKLRPEERALIAGPLALMAAVTAVVLPLRIANSALVGLQDVRYSGAMTTAAWALDAVLTVALLFQGYGLWALAIGASVPSALTATAALIRLRRIAPDLLHAWPRPSRAAVVSLFKEGGGGWLGAWGWRLSSATDAVIIASLADPVGITMLSMTARLGQMLTNMAWLPGDSALVGLAQLAGEGRGERLRAAMTALIRVYLTLATVAACVVLAANPGFVKGWVGAEQFAGQRVNLLLAVVVLAASAGHALGASVSVLGKRLYVGGATLATGVAHVILAYTLARAFGLVGLPMAGALTQGLIFVPLLLPALRAVSGIGIIELLGRVLLPWLRRALPLIALATAAGLAFADVPIWIAVPLGGLFAVITLFICRHLILEYPPVAAMIRARLAFFRLDGLLPADPPPQPGA